MAIYKIVVQHSTDKDIRKIDKVFIEKIVDSIHKLGENPYPKNCIKLKGSESSFRILVGNYRVIYEVNEFLKTVTVFYIRHRKDAYRK